MFPDGKSELNHRNKIPTHNQIYTRKICSLSNNSCPKTHQSVVFTNCMGKHLKIPSELSKVKKTKGAIKHLRN